MANTYLTRTVTSAGNRKTWTFSCWVKRCVTSANGSVGYDSIFSTNISNVGINIAFGNGAFTNTGDYFEVTHAAASGGGTTDWSVRTNQLFGDVAGWYHLVVAFDTTQSTTADRVKIYVNGVEVDKTVTTGPALNTDYEINNTQQHTIGRWQRDGNSYFDGSLAHFHFCDGTAYQASDFGQTDSTTGIWKPKSAPSVTYGTNGFFLKFASSGSMGTDSSGNSNTWAVSGGTLTQTQDTPSNVFATLNPLVINRFANAGTPTNGNTSIAFTGGDADTGMEFSTMGVTSGKWYWEIKMPVITRASFGVGYMQDLVAFTNTYYDNSPSKGFSVYASSGDLNYDNTYTTYGSAFSSNDIAMVALDMDNHLCWFGKNGTWFNSATQSEIENSTATNDATTAMGTQQNLNNGEYVFPFVMDSSTTGQSSFHMNFGNGYFGTTAVSTANSDANGYGLFEYSVPSGYYALCTKNIKEFG